MFLSVLHLISRCGNINTEQVFLDDEMERGRERGTGDGADTGSDVNV